MILRFTLRRALVAGCAAIVAGLAENTAFAAPVVTIHMPLAARASASVLGGGRIKHVIVLIQENRSFDNLFNGFPGADTVSVGLGHNGQRIALVKSGLEQIFDPQHGHTDWLTEYDGGKMDGFDLEKTDPSTSQANPAYEFVDPNEIGPYFSLAKQYGLADRMFASQTGPSYPGHAYIIAGQSNFAIGNPTDPFGRWGCDARTGTTTEVLTPTGNDVVDGPYPCFDYQTLGDLLDRAGIAWRYYANIGSQAGLAEILPDPYDAIRHIRFGADWASDTTTSPEQILTDIPFGNLAPVSWVNPPFVASDHPQSNLGLGPSWVGAIVNEVEQSRYASDTVVLVTWDDWGGWYDHVKPRRKDVMGLGFRVPLLVVSPYVVHPGYVSHVEHEYGSIVHFIEDVFGLPSLGQRDATSDDLSDFFRFAQPLVRRPLVRTRVGRQTLMQLPPDTRGDEE